MAPRSTSQSSGGRTPVAIICRTGSSGLTDYSVSLARELAKSTRVQLITGRELSSHYRTFGFEPLLWFGRARHFVIDVWRLLALCFRGEKWIILFQSWLLMPVLEIPVIWALRLAGHRVCITVHDTLPHYPMPWSGALMSAYYRQFDRIVAHSEQGREDLKRLRVHRPILVVPHGSYDLFMTRPCQPEMAREALSLPPNSTVVLLFGRLTSRKGVFEFLEIAKRMQAQSSLWFVLAGRNDLNEKEKPLLEKARSLSNVLLHDHEVQFEDVQTYFTAATFVLLPYLEGTTSGVFKLALAFKRLTLATAVGDLKEAAENGYLISLGEPESVVENAVLELTRLLSDDHPQWRSGETLLKSPTDINWDTIALIYYEFLSSTALE